MYKTSKESIKPKKRNYLSSLLNLLVTGDNNVLSIIPEGYLQVLAMCKIYLT